MRVSKHLAKDANQWEKEEWQQSMDEQILQKVLPKLHGSIGRIGKLIAQLVHFTHNPEAKSFSELSPDFATLNQADAFYPKSFAKLKEMSETLNEEQFVSFI